MHASVVVENRIFVGEIRGSRLDELPDQMGLARQRPARQQNRPVLPGHDPGMNEQFAPGKLGHRRTQMGVVTVQQDVQPVRPPDNLMFRIDEMVVFDAAPFAGRR